MGILPMLMAIGFRLARVLRSDALLARDELSPVLIALDLAEPTEILELAQTLREALALMNARGQDALPVVRTTEHGARFAGLLSRDGILQAYERTLSRAI